jgi:hypothetical protein
MQEDHFTNMSEEMARKVSESVRSLPDVMHRYNNPLGIISAVIKDLEDFLLDNPGTAKQLVPDLARATNRARMSGTPEDQTLASCLLTLKSAASKIQRTTALSQTSEREKAKAAVLEEMARAKAEGMILSLSNDEVLLLTAYREWKLGNASGSPVFHFRKP